MAEEQKSEPEKEVEEPESELIGSELLFEARTICENAGYIVTTSADLLKVWGIGLLLTIILGLVIGFSIYSVYTCS